MAAPALLTADRYEEPVLVLRYGERVDGPFVEVVDGALRHFTTYGAARAQVLAAPLNYRQTAAALGVGVRWLERQVQSDPTLPHCKVGNHILFLADQVEDIRERCRRGELRYSGPLRGGRRD